MSVAAEKLLTVADLALRYRCTIKTVRDTIVHRPGFPKPIMPTGSVRLRLWREDEVARWDVTDGRKAA